MGVVQLLGEGDRLLPVADHRDAVEFRPPRGRRLPLGGGVVLAAEGSQPSTWPRGRARRAESRSGIAGRLYLPGRCACNGTSLDSGVRSGGYWILSVVLRLP